MKPKTSEDIYGLLQGYVRGAALGAALELGLFWLVDARTLSAKQVSARLSIPLNRTQHWLQILCSMGLLQEIKAGYTLTTLGRETIVGAYSQETWAFLAGEDRQKYPAVTDLALNISKPVSTWLALGKQPPDYVAKMLADPDQARRFTRMLYELHQPLAKNLAAVLDLHGIKRLIDLGGGSGVMSHALLRKQKSLTSLVIDIENVCNVGREIAKECGLADRLDYQALNFVEDDLPAGFDLALFCDVGPLEEDLFRKIFSTLNPGGRLVIVAQFAPDPTHAPPQRLMWAFLGSLDNPRDELGLKTIDLVASMCTRSGFEAITSQPIPADQDIRWLTGWTALIARKPI